MRRPAAALAVALALTLGPAAPVGASLPGPTTTPQPAPAAAPTSPPLSAERRAAETAASDAHAKRAELLARLAELSDRMEAAQAGVVGAQWKRQQSASVLAKARGALRERAVTAFILGRTVRGAAMSGPSVFLEVAERKAVELVARTRDASTAADDANRQAESHRQSLREDAATMAVWQAQLDNEVQARDATLERVREADEARHRAEVARRAQEEAEALAAAAGHNGDDPVVLTERHRRATAAQAAFMAGRPFGPLAGSALPKRFKATGQQVEGLASWYGPGFDGHPTATGAVYDQEGWTCASPDLPLGTMLVVRTGDRAVLLLVNDRGPYVPGRVLDLSHAAATALGWTGLSPVNASVVTDS